jgi:pimeloyl-ACP methyl ester carboxylesterase
MPELEIIRRAGVGARRRLPLLFVHGAYTGAWCWDESFLPHFAALGFDVHAVSLRGHGRSAGGESLDLAGIDDYVEDLLAAARGLDRTPAVIAHSMGGIVAQRYVRTHGARALMLIGCLPPYGLMGSNLELGWRAPDLLAQFALVQSGYGHLADLGRLRTALFARDTTMAQAVRHFMRMGRESQRALLELSWPQMCTVRLPADVPIGVLAGEEDGLFRPNAVRCTADWHAVEAAILPGLGHTLMLDPGWRRAADWIVGWLEKMLPAEAVPISSASRPAARRARHG